MMVYIPHLHDVAMDGGGKLRCAATTLVLRGRSGRLFNLGASRILSSISSLWWYIINTNPVIVCNHSVFIGSIDIYNFIV